MMKKIYTLLLSVCFSVTAIYAQVVTINANPTGTSPNIVFGTLAYHASENLYKDAELGNTSFTTVPISKVGFNVGVVGSPTTFTGVNIYMKNSATTVLATGTYSTGTFTLVYSGPVTLDATGFNTITLTTPFLRTAGTNLHVLIERTDGAAHTGYVYIPSLDDPTGVAATNVARRYNGAAAPVSGSTSLAASTFRAAIELSSALPVDATFSDLTLPGISCHTAPQTTSIVVFNNGTNPIAAGALSVALDISGANTYSTSLNNSGVIAPNATETITFPGINLNTPGNNDYSFIVNLPGDGNNANDSVFVSGATANVITTFPAVEDVETTLPVISYLSRIAGSRQLWNTNPFYPGAYGNIDMADSLRPHGGSDFFIFDSYSGANSDGVESRLFSNCITLTHSDDESSNNMSFWLSHDSSFRNSPDSMYVSVSTDKGITWNRIAGFARYDSVFVFPDWRQETVDLSAYGCQTIQIGFEGVSKYGNVIGLDDISINSVGTGSCTVPLTLLSFNAQKLNTVNKLTWKTAQEINTLKFVIEQSRDGRSFTQLGEVLAAGNSNNERTYTYSHNQPLKGFNYYRIKMVDIDGRFTYSPVRSLQNLGINEISSYPNPVKGAMQVAINAEKNDVATVQITDMSGKTVYSKVYSVTEGENNFTIDAARFNAGNYILKVQLSGDVVVKKFTKL